MEEKFLILEVLRLKKGFIDCNHRNDLLGSRSKSHSKPPKLSQSRIIVSSSKKKAKNVLKLGKSTVKLYNLLENSNIPKNFNHCLDLSAISEKKINRGSSGKTCDAMDSNETKAENSNESSNFENETAVYSLRTKHSNGELSFGLNCNKEMAEESDKNSSINGQSNSKKFISNKRQSEDGFFNGFKEFELNDHNHSCQSMRNISAAVQEWIDHLPSENSERNFKEIISGKEEKGELFSTAIIERTPPFPAKLSRETSLQSSSSLDSLLDSRKPDPVEIFLNLGFGGVPGVNMDNCRIPKRFLVPSQCKGGNWNEFLRRELIQAQNFECSSLGFRGLSGPSYRRPSAIVANIMEKLRERSISQPYNRPKFLAVVKRVLNDKNVQNQLSVLSPDSRKFLQNQGKKSPEVPRRRIIFGQKSFAFAKDGEFVEVESAQDSGTGNDDITSPILIKNDGKSDDSIGENSLKIRRCSLQKQKRIEEDSDLDGICVVENESNLKEEEKDCDCDSRSLGSASKFRAKKSNSKIPRRFFSSANLKTLELESDMKEIMREEVEKEIGVLSKKIRNVSDRDLISVLKQVKQLSAALENTGNVSLEV